MSWQDVTTKISTSFSLQGCFLLDEQAREWVGRQPPASFCELLAEQLRTKPSTYFDEIRFFKLSREQRTGEAAYLALLPVTMKHVPYRFLGLMYRTPEQLQELLRFRILPMYLTFYLHQMVAEARVRNAGEDKQKALLRALEEKRLYAERLEHKVRNLTGEIDRVRNAEMGLDQKVARLSELLESQSREYQTLANAYRELFARFEEGQKEHLQSSVALEIRIHELEREKAGLMRALADERGEGLVPLESLEEAQGQLLAARQNLERLQARNDALEAERGQHTGDALAQARQKITALKQQVALYRNRSVQLGARVDQMKAALRERERS